VRNCFKAQVDKKIVELESSLPYSQEPATEPYVKIIIIIINCNWVVTRWQWLFYMYTNMKKKR